MLHYFRHNCVNVQDDFSNIKSTFFSFVSMFCILFFLFSYTDKASQTAGLHEIKTIYIDIKLFSLNPHLA